MEDPSAQNNGSKNLTYNMVKMYYKKERINAKGEKLKMEQPNYAIDNLSPKFRLSDLTDNILERKMMTNDGILGAMFVGEIIAFDAFERRD